MAEAWDEMGIGDRRNYYRDLRHSCGFTGANKERYDPKCEKCRMKYAGALREEPVYEDSRYGVGRKPSLDDYDRY
jgi:hypothetical protein